MENITIKYTCVGCVKKNISTEFPDGVTISDNKAFLT